MAYNVPSFLKKDGDSLIFNKPGEFIFYVPEIYFDRGVIKTLRLCLKLRKPLKRFDPNFNWRNFVPLKNQGLPFWVGLWL